MRGDPQSRSIRLPAAIPRRRWLSWIIELKRKRRRVREEQLEVIERLARQERRERRSGEYTPDLKCERRWC
jgi:hypothetical protein